MNGTPVLLHHKDILGLPERERKRSKPIAARDTRIPNSVQFGMWYMSTARVGDHSKVKVETNL